MCAGGGFDVEVPGVVFDLHGCDGVDCVCAAEGVGGAFGEAKVFDFALTLIACKQSVLYILKE